MRLRTALILALVACGVVAGFLLRRAATLDESMLAAIGSKLPAGPEWRTFAKPLAIGNVEMLLFQRAGKNAVVWRVDWRNGRVNSFGLKESVLDDDSRYTALASKAGTWLLGKTPMLIRPDGQILWLWDKAEFDEPVAAALDDGSVLVFGKSVAGKGGAIYQLRLNAVTGLVEAANLGLLSYDGKPNQSGAENREPRYGHAVAKLADGRVLMLGGETTPRRASVVSVQGEGEGVRAQVTPVAPMPHPRVSAAALTLSDGRVAVVGAPYLGCTGDAADTRSVDLYDATNNRWTSLPPLPFTPCIDAYGASGGPSLELTPSGALVVGGHLEPHVMVLRRDAGSATGFAASWSVHGQFADSRISGVVQAVSDTDVVVAGGVANRRHDFGGCCHAMPGLDHAAIGSLEGRESRALRYLGVGVARRGSLVFAAAGRRFGYTGFGQLRYSAHAELIDLNSGIVRQLPNVPFVTGSAQALWIDDDRVVLKGKAVIAGDWDLQSYKPESSGALAVFNVKANRWDAVIAQPEIKHSDLVDVVGDEIRLSISGREQRVNLGTRAVRDDRSLREFVFYPKRELRLTVPNPQIVGGGTARTDLISIIDEACEADGRSDCPESYAGLGLYPGKTGLEFPALGEVAKGVGAAGDSAAASRHARTTAVSSDGTVYIVEPLPGKDGDIQWLPLPLPEKALVSLPNGGISSCATNRPSNCVLLRAVDPRDSAQELLFLRQGDINLSSLDDEVERLNVRVWLWDEARRNWEPVLETDGMSARAKPLELSAGAFGVQGKSVMSMGWHLPTPILWLAPR